MKKSKLFYWLLIVQFLVMMVACHSRTGTESLAMYVGDPKNGLTRKEIVDGNTVICQLIPESAGANSVYRFRLYIDSPPGVETADSVIYYFNYHSSDIFSLVVKGDTLRPALSERVANGRKNNHEFTLLFNGLSPNEKNPGNIQLLIEKNLLLPKNIVFDYQHSDITKASKTLYGYDQVKN